ncbi:hypothetical protein NGM37_19490, partial [Streptomyces sp. TRM76130]|nr:hypothetical protein [Streptomyces sp. TRM76130]
GDGGGGGGQATGPRPANPASGGVAAHSTRPSGGGGTVPSAAPVPRSGSPMNSPHSSTTRTSKSTGGDGR